MIPGLKLATKRDESRDGQLVVVSKDLAKAVTARAVAKTMQAAIENWAIAAPQLEQIYSDLNSGKLARAFAVQTSDLAAPFPRAYQWLDASAYHSHGDLLEKVFKLDPPPDKHAIPLMYQGGSDDFLGPCDDILLPAETDGIDFEGEIAVVVDDVPMGISAAAAAPHIKLLMLVNDVSLRAFVQREVRTGFGFLQAKPASSFSPVAVTPDELGTCWAQNKVHLPLQVFWNGKEFGHPNAGEMGFGFDELIQHAAKTRNLRAGTIIGAGTVSNHNYREVGSACIAERRAIEMLDFGQPKTPFMKFGDEVRIRMEDASGRAIFGEIHQRVAQYKL